MDGNMGGLLGIRYYSKIEFICLYIAGVGMLASWSLSQEVQFFSIIGIIFFMAYMVVCYGYAIYARQPSVGFLVLSGLPFGFGIWRVARFLDHKFYNDISYIFCFLMIISLIGIFVMKIRAPRREWFIARFIRIKSFKEE